MIDDNTGLSALQKLIEEDAIGQLHRRDGLMATLGSEDGALKLDWVEGVARLLADPVMLEEEEAEAKDIWQRGIRHIIWAGMGGSVLTVRVLCGLGFCSGQVSSLSSQQRQESSESAGSPGQQFSWLAVEHGPLWLPATYYVRRSACCREL